MPRHFRYLALISGVICIRTGTLDELHRIILARNQRNGFRTTFDEIDTWVEPGRIVEEDGLYKWEPAA